MFFMELTLCGVLQSYGSSNSGWATKRDTEYHPTISGVAGLLACCLGTRKGEEGYEHLLGLKYLYRVNPWPGTESRDVTLLHDYQIVSPKDPKHLTGETDFRLLNNSRTGKQRPIMKTYLQGVSFSVLVGSESLDELKHLHAAIRNPKWVYYLGRACCTPSKEVVPLEFKVLTEEEIAEDYVCI